jgi:hypothetical protein
MVTGDQHAIAVETSRRLGLGTDIMEGAELLQGQPDGALGDKVNLVDGFAGVYPEHKYAIVEAYQSHGRLVGMTGERGRRGRTWWARRSVCHPSCCRQQNQPRLAPLNVLPHMLLQKTHLNSAPTPLPAQATA